MQDIELFHGDCLDIMKDFRDQSVHMILCDLPYGTSDSSWDKIINFENSRKLSLFSSQTLGRRVRVKKEEKLK